jgi:hypothetical protein
MDIFLLGAIGFVLAAVIIYVVASVRLERSRRLQRKTTHVGGTHNETR